MVDTKQALESEFVTVELVRESATKKLVVYDPGSYENTDYGDKLTLGVNIDGKKKKWRPNKDSITALQAYGADTVNWVGKLIALKIEKRNGKDCVIGYPEPGEIKK